MRRVIIGVVLLLLWTSVVSNHGYAQDPIDNSLPGEENACVPVDLIMVIDQSDSMRFTDTNNIRLDAVRSMIDRLFLDAVTRCPEITHTLSVIGFGNRVELMIDRAEIGLTNEAVRDDWVAISEQLKGEIIVARLGQTNLALALVDDPNSARNLLANTNNPSPIPSQKAVVLVTDGNPCTQDAAESNLCGNATWLRHYFYADQIDTYPLDRQAESGFDTSRGLITLLNDNIPPSESNPIRFSTLLFSDDVVRDSVNQAWTDITAARNGIYVPPERLDDRNKLTRELNTLINNLLDVETIPIVCGQEFYLEPYASSATLITSLRLDSDLNISIVHEATGIDVANTNVTGQTRVQYIERDSVERFLIVNPRPGAYTITVEGQPELCQENIQLEYSTVRVRVNPIIPEAPVTVNVVPDFLTDTRLRLRITNVYDEPFLLDPQHPLFICGRITAPERAIQVGFNPDDCLIFSPNPQQDGLWESELLPAPVQGTYTVDILGTVQSVNPNNENSTITIFNETVTYSTAPQTEVFIAVTEPFDGQIIQANNLNDNDQPVSIPIPIIVELLAGTESVNPEQLFYNFQDAPMSATLLLAGEVVEQIPLQIADQSLRGTFLSGLPDAVQEGIYTVRVQLTEDAMENYNQENYTIANPSPITFDIERRQLRGIQFELISSTIVPVFRLDENAEAVNQNLEVRYRLVDQNGDVVNITEAYPNFLNDQVFRAYLNGTGISSFLGVDPNDPTVLQGQLTPALQQPGNFQLHLEITDTPNVQRDNERFAALLPYTPTTTITVNDTFGLLPTVRIPQPNIVLRANQINLTTRTESAVGIEINAMITNGLSERTFRLQDYLQPDATQILKATITGPEDTFQEIWLTQTAGGFTGTALADKIYPAGLYTLKVSIAEDAFINDEKLAFVSLESTPVQFTLEVLEAVQLSLDAIDGVQVDVVLQRETTTPLFDNWLDAAFGEVDPITFEFSIRDLSDEVVNWRVLLNNPDETINDIMTVKVVNLENPSEELPTIVEVTDNNRILVEVESVADSEATYQLEYQLTRDFESNDNIRNLLSTTQTFTIIRTIDGPLTNPATYRWIFRILSFFVVLVLIYLLYLNVFNRMRGVIRLTYYPSGWSDPISLDIRLSRLRFFPAINVKRKFRSDDEQLFVKVSISRGRVYYTDSSNKDDFFSSFDQSDETSDEMVQVFFVNIEDSQGFFSHVEVLPEDEAYDDKVTVEHTLLV